MTSIKLIAAGLLCATAGLAQAQNTTTVVTGSPYVERVPFQASELASAAGVRGLESRVRKASHRVCDLGQDSFTAGYRERICYHATLPGALAQVDRAVALAQRGALASAARIVVAAR